MKKIDVASLLRDAKNIIETLQSAVQNQTEEKMELPLRQRQESLSWWAQEALIETKKVTLN